MFPIGWDNLKADKLLETFAMTRPHVFYNWHLPLSTPSFLGIQRRWANGPQNNTFYSVLVNNKCANGNKDILKGITFDDAKIELPNGGCPIMV